MCTCMLACVQACERERDHTFSACVYMKCRHVCVCVGGGGSDRGRQRGEGGHTHKHIVDY